MKGAEDSPDSGQTARPTPRKTWSTPTVILSTVRAATGTTCSPTQGAGQVEHKATPNTTATLIHS
jgi:hypothetical protein